MDKSLALLCARLSRAVYTSRIEVPDFQLTHRFENAGTDTQGIFGIAFRRYFVTAFRGSEDTNIADWIRDLKLTQAIYPYEGHVGLSGPRMRVHFGFLEAYHSIREATLQAARSTRASHIVCTGHSLGAALATLAARDLQVNVAGKDLSCYTFGSPKVGNWVFARSYDQLVPDTYRFVNDDDLIPTLPPLLYSHLGQLIHLAGETDATNKTFSARVNDHFPHNYINAILRVDAAGGFP